MPNDPGLTRDTCIYSEAVAGDGGVHPSINFWMSPDISLTGPVSGPDKADPGQINTCQVRFHRKAAESQCLSSDSEALTVELWVGNPAIVMTPNNPQSAVRIEYIGSPIPLPGASGTQLIQWTPPTGLPPTDPQGPGHKCLIARAYPDNLTASDVQFYLPEDQHVVQRNVCVVPCNASNRAKQGAAGAEEGKCEFTVTTVNPDADYAQKVKVTVVQDLDPVSHVKETVMRALNAGAAVERLSLSPANRFGLELSDFPDAVIRDNSTATTAGAIATYEAEIGMKAGQFTRFNFFADLSGSPSGDVHIFHLSQSNTDGQVQGGLTIVMLS